MKSTYCKSATAVSVDDNGNASWTMQGTLSFWRGNEVIRTMLMFFLSLCTLLSGCGVNKQEFILNQLDVSKYRTVMRQTGIFFGEFTGCVFKCGDIIFYSQYTYKQQKYEPRSWMAYI
ncbi:MAG: hypothetical protein V8T45_04265 [Oscillospiraceae bacterium]